MWNNKTHSWERNSSFMGVVWLRIEKEAHPKAFKNLQSAAVLEKTMEQEK